MFAEMPPRVEYNLTDQAKELEPILKELSQWAIKWNDKKTQSIIPKSN